MCVPTNLSLILLINNASNIHFNTQVLTRTFLLDEIHVAFTALCGTQSHSGVVHMYVTNKNK